MAIALSNAFVQLFDAEVKQAYQAKAQLVGAVRQRRGVEGSSVKFPKVGKGVATARIPQTDVTPMNVGFSQVTCTLADWNAAEYSDIFSQQKVNFDERQELVQVVANAIGRRQDQIILDALAASSTSLIVTEDEGGDNTGLNVAKLRAAKKLLDKNNVPFDNRHAVIHANSLASLLGETSVTSSDFNTVRALVSGEVNTFRASPSIPLVIALRADCLLPRLSANCGSSTATLSVTPKALPPAPKSTTSLRRPRSW